MGNATRGRGGENPRKVSIVSACRVYSLWRVYTWPCKSLCRVTETIPHWQKCSYVSIIPATYVVIFQYLTSSMSILWSDLCDKPLSWGEALATWLAVWTFSLVISTYTPWLTGLGLYPCSFRSCGRSRGRRGWQHQPTPTQSHLAFPSLAIFIWSSYMLD